MRLRYKITLCMIFFLTNVAYAIELPLELETDSIHVNAQEQCSLPIEKVLKSSSKKITEKWFKSKKYYTPLFFQILGMINAYPFVQIESKIGDKLAPPLKRNYLAKFYNNESIKRSKFLALIALYELEQNDDFKLKEKKNIFYSKVLQQRVEALHTTITLHREAYSDGENKYLCGRVVGRGVDRDVFYWLDDNQIDAYYYGNLIRWTIGGEQNLVIPNGLYQRGILQNIQEYYMGDSLKISYDFYSEFSYSAWKYLDLSKYKDLTKSSVYFNCPNSTKFSPIKSKKNTYKDITVFYRKYNKDSNDVELLSNSFNIEYRITPTYMHLNNTRYSINIDCYWSVSDIRAYERKYNRAETWSYLPRHLIPYQKEYLLMLTKFSEIDESLQNILRYLNVSEIDVQEFLEAYDREVNLTRREKKGSRSIGFSFFVNNYKPNEIPKTFAVVLFYFSPDFDKVSSREYITGYRASAVVGYNIVKSDFVNGANWTRVDFPFFATTKLKERK